MSRPTKETVAGRAYLGLRSKAKAAGRPMAEYLRLYALEGFLLRPSQSEHRERFVLKGGVLLAAHDLRRPTTDIDVAALRTAGTRARSDASSSRWHRRRFLTPLTTAWSST